MSKLIVCSPQLGIAPESNSGGEVYDREVIRSLCDQGIKTIVILPKNKHYIPHKNLKVYYLPIPFVWPPCLFNLFILPWLHGLYKKYKFNILRVHSPYFVGLGALFFKMLYPKISLVTTYHHLEEKNPLFDLINKLFIHKWDYIICVSKFTREEIVERYKVDKNKTAVVYNGIGLKFRPKRKREDLVFKYKLKNKKTLLFLGELKPRKNISFLLKALNDIKVSNIKLVICGSGRLEGKLKNMSKRLNLQNDVIFTGFIPEEDKVDYYSLADIFLFPSKLEGFGMPVIEAAACGIPAIVSDTASLAELVVDGKTGYLAKLNDLNDWKEKIEGLLENDNLRKKMGKEAEKFSKSFSWDKTAQKQTEIYKKQLAIKN